jgi:hypothetical protein
MNLVDKIRWQTCVRLGKYNYNMSGWPAGLPSGKSKNEVFAWHQTLRAAPPTPM